MSLRELRQVSVGNELLLFSFMCLILLSGQNGCGAIEHPAEPKSLHSASIWRTEIVGLLLQIPGFNLLTFAQGLMGAKSAKPTSLLTLNLPTMASCIVKHRLTADLPVASSIGRDSDGHWKTTTLKEYPPSFCHALAESFAAAASGLEVDAETSVEPHYWKTCQSIMVDLVDSFEQCVGPDYAK